MRIRTSDKDGKLEEDKTLSIPPKADLVQSQIMAKREAYEEAKYQAIVKSWCIALNEKIQDEMRDEEPHPSVASQAKTINGGDGLELKGFEFESVLPIANDSRPHLRACEYFANFGWRVRYYDRNTPKSSNGREMDSYVTIVEFMFSKRADGTPLRVKEARSSTETTVKKTNSRKG